MSFRRTIPSRPTLKQLRLAQLSNAPLDPLEELFAGAPTQRFDEMEAAEIALKANGTRAPRKRNKSPEADFQKTVAVYLGRVLHPSVPFTAFPAGGGGRIRGARLQGLGLKKGWPDLLLLLPGTGKFLGLELKARRNGLSPDQVAVCAQIRAAGGEYGSARTLDEVEALLRLWAVPMRGKIAV